MPSSISLEENKLEFSWYDYGLFVFMLGLSVLIGIYFGYFGKKQSSANEYLLGGKSMKVWPVAMSLIASNISCIAVLSIPADVYKYGATIIFISISHIIGCLVSAYITVPVFHNLPITSTYEYLKLRFNSTIRIMGSILYNINTMLYLPIVIYGPALALSQVTSFNLHLINPILCAICIFYTTIGGLKAVVWTDTLQLTAMLGALVAVLAIGVMSIGGLSNVFVHAYAGGRLDIDFDMDPTKRDTFWAIILGWTIFSMPQIAINQGTIQKFWSLPTLSDAKKALVIYGFGTIFFKSSGILTGLIMYAKYHDCDPFMTKQVKKDDQLLPYFVMDVANKIPGLSGLFIAGVFCASLSTLSAHMNSLSGLIYEDFLLEFMPKDITQERVSNILKIIVVIIGVVATALVLVVQHLGGLFQLGITLSGITAGPLLGLFTLGMLFPFANSKGALAGSITSLILTAFIVIKNQLYKVAGVITYPPKSLSVDGCGLNSSLITNDVRTPVPNEDIFVLFKITHYYNTLIGVLILLIVALPVSWFTKNDDPVDEALIAPAMRWAVAKKSTQKVYGINDGELDKLNGTDVVLNR